MTNMSLSKACRLIFRPSSQSKSNIIGPRGHFLDCCTALYANVYTGTFQGLPFCRLSVARLLEVSSSILSRGPIWAFWKFHVERAIGTLPPMILSRSKLHEALTSAMTRK